MSAPSLYSFMVAVGLTVLFWPASSSLSLKIKKTINYGQKFQNQRVSMYQVTRIIFIYLLIKLSLCVTVPKQTDSVCTAKCTQLAL